MRESVILSSFPDFSRVKTCEGTSEASQMSMNIPSQGKEVIHHQQHLPQQHNNNNAYYPPFKHFQKNMKTQPMVAQQPVSQQVQQHPPQQIYH